MINKSYADGEYLDKNPTWHAEDSAWKAGRIINIINKNGIRPKLVCEVGCGAGEILKQLSLKMSGEVRFEGYEISPQAFELCRQRENDKLHFHFGSIFETENPACDVVLAIDVVEHIDDYMGFLRKLRGKGAYTVFHIPLDISVQSVLRAGPLLECRGKVGHIHYFTKETALETLKDTGYEIIDHFYTATSIDLPARSFKGLLARAPRKMLFTLNKDLAVRILGGYELLVLAK